MRSLDNGPPDGDYARYLDRLVRERLPVAAVAAPSAMVERDASVVADPAARASTAGAATRSSRAAPTGADGASRPSLATAGRDGRAASPSAASASAATSGRGFAVATPALPAPDLPLAKMFFSLLFGVVLIVFGVVAQPVAWIAIAGGVASLFAAVRPLLKAPVVRLGQPTSPDR